MHRKRRSAAFSLAGADAIRKERRKPYGKNTPLIGLPQPITHPLDHPTEIKTIIELLEISLQNAALTKTSQASSVV